ncbi:MAG TPA: DNA repair protein RecN [Bryobacteraceae bacterium]|jgi:DNA repair protein RecN (Recombination protein N)
MLVELVVENYAVIERVRVHFHTGLNLLTGETGSGKSIVVDALGLLFGGRSSAEMVRSGADRARVSGVFEIPSAPELLALLQQAGIEPEEGELLVEREIQSSGKSRALVGNRPATAALLRDLAPFLGDIHGQHDQQQLFSATVQRDMLDAFAGAEELAREVAARYRQWHALTTELEELDRTSQEKLRLADLWAFQRKEIEGVAPKPGEDAELENERRVLGNVVRLQESAGAAYAALYEDTHSAVAQLGAAAKRLDEVARIDESIREVIAALKPAIIGAEEAAYALRHYLGALEADPRRLDEVEARLNAIEKLTRKYGATIADTLAFLDQVKIDLAAVETSSERRQTLEKDIAQAASAYETTASRLSVKRSEAAVRLGQRVERELAALAMEKTRVEIRVEAASGSNGWSEHGSDAVRILISPNPGEEPKPLEKIASGGELSRVALALKTCTGTKTGGASPLTLVFDEVDAGVGGSAAEAVGRRLKKLSRGSQVICVTHLPQIAGFADHHYSVEKHTVKGRTAAAIEELTPEARTREIGRMLSGERVTPEALRHAEQLIKLGVE